LPNSSFNLPFASSSLPETWSLFINVDLHSVGLEILRMVSWHFRTIRRCVITQRYGPRSRISLGDGQANTPLPIAGQRKSDRALRPGAEEASSLLQLSTIRRRA
jgi:hypothetical protein